MHEPQAFLLLSRHPPIQMIRKPHLGGKEKRTVGGTGASALVSTVAGSVTGATAVSSGLTSGTTTVVSAVDILKKRRELNRRGEHTSWEGVKGLRATRQGSNESKGSKEGKWEEQSKEKERKETNAPSKIDSKKERDGGRRGLRRERERGE